MLDASLRELRVLCTVAEHGSITTAARELGYSQSAVSRQVQALELAAGRRLFARGRGGTEPTPDGRALVAAAAQALAVLDAAIDGDTRDVRRTVRLGAFASAAAGLVPRALRGLRVTHPDVDVVVREGTSAALVRALRSGSLDLALVASAPPFRPLDDLSPALSTHTLTQADLHLAIAAAHPLAARGAAHVADLTGERWIVSRATGDETLLGVWPGLPGRPRVVATVRDWLVKLELVAAGVGITTVPAVLSGALPAAVASVPVLDGPQESRRLLAAHLPERTDEPALGAVRAALARAARERMRAVDRP